MKAAQEGEGTQVTSISYSVFVLHHSCTLVYTIPLPGTIVLEGISKIRLHFAAIHDLS